MKASFKFAVLALIAITAVIGCGKDKNGNRTEVQCDQYGQCYDPTTGYTYQNGAYGNPNAYNPYAPTINNQGIIAEGQLSLSDDPKNNWKAALRSMGACDGFNQIRCHMMDESAPFVRIIIDNYKFEGPGKTSIGQLYVFNHALFASPEMPVVWNITNAGKGFAVQNNFGSPRVTLRSVNTPLAGQMQVELRYSNIVIATGTLVRKNR